LPDGPPRSVRVSRPRRELDACVCSKVLPDRSPDRDGRNGRHRLLGFARRVVKYAGPPFMPGGTLAHYKRGAPKFDELAAKTPNGALHLPDWSKALGTATAACRTPPRARRRIAEYRLTANGQIVSRRAIRIGNCHRERANARRFIPLMTPSCGDAPLAEWPEPAEGYPSIDSPRTDQ